MYNRFIPTSILSAMSAGLEKSANLRGDRKSVVIKILVTKVIEVAIEQLLLLCVQILIHLNI